MSSPTTNGAYRVLWATHLTSVHGPPNRIPWDPKEFEGDADQDGIKNGLKYAGLRGAPEISVEDGEWMVLSFGFRREAQSDVMWTVSRSGDLSEFTEILQVSDGEIDALRFRRIGG